MSLQIFLVNTVTGILCPLWDVITVWRRPYLSLCVWAIRGSAAFVLRLHRNKRVFLLYRRGGNSSPSSRSSRGCSGVARSCNRIDCIAQADKMPQRSIMQLGFLYDKQLLTDIQRSSRFLLCCRRGSSRSCFLPRRCSTLQSLLQRLIRSERGLKKTHLRLLQPRLIAHSNVNATLTFHLTVRSWNSDSVGLLSAAENESDCFY